MEKKTLNRVFYMRKQCCSWHAKGGGAKLANIAEISYQEIVEKFLLFRRPRNGYWMAQENITETRLILTFREKNSRSKLMHTDFNLDQHIK